MIKLCSNFLLFVLATAITRPCPADEALDTTPIITALIEVAGNGDAEVRTAAFNALTQQPRSDELLELFWHGLEDDDVQIRRLCLDKVVEFEGPTVRVLTRLISIVEKTNDTAARRTAQAAQTHLIAIGPPAIPYLIGSLKRNEANYYAAAALGEIPLGEHQTAVAKQLTALLTSEDKAVQLASVRSLHKIMAADAKAVAFAKALADAQSKDLEPRYLEYYTKVLQKYDSNADGSLNKEEWSKMAVDPAAADANQDGMITAVELGKWSQIR